MITEDIRYIGVNDHDIDLFEGQYQVPNGISYNSYVIMDEKGDDAALGMDEEVTESEIPAPKREIERSADSVKRPSILAQLHEKQAERMAEPKPQKKKSHDMEL